MNESDDGKVVMAPPQMAGELVLHNCRIRTSRGMRTDGVTMYLMHFDMPFGLTVTVPFDEGGFDNVLRDMTTQRSGVYLP